MPTVNVGTVPRQGLVGQDDEDEIVSGIVLMRKGENPSEVLAAVKERVAALNDTVLPKPAKIVAFYDRTTLINTTLSTVFRNLLEGAALVAVVLFLFMGNLRAAGIVAVIIPLSLLATFIGLRIRGIPANLLSLGAMDFGIIVDGAVIVMENVFRHLSEPQDHHRAAKATILDATTEVARPTMFSMLVIIIAHLPIFTLQRHEGRIFAPMAFTVVSALIGSLLFSFTLVPLLSLWLLGRGVKEGDNLLVRVCKRLYRPVLRLAIERRVVVLLIAVSLLAASLTLVPRLGTEFLPELNEGALWINIMLPPGISVTETSRQLSRIRGMLRQFPEVLSVTSKAGRPEDGTDPKMINMAEFLVDVKPQAAWRPHLSKDQLTDQMNARLQTIPGIEPSFSQPIRDNVLESISQIDGQIVVKVFGDDMDTLRRLANEVLHTISSVRGVARAFVDRGGQVPQLQIEIDRARAARYGLNVADVEDVIETELGGKTATELWEGERRFGVVVRLSEEERRDENAIKNVLVDTPTGLRIPLSEVASIVVGSGSMNIARESGSRVAAIGVFIQGRDMGSIVSEMQERVKANVHLPAGYVMGWGGEFENQQRAMARLTLIVPISVLLIFVLLFNAFGSVKHALLILVNVPFALVGGHPGAVRHRHSLERVGGDRVHRAVRTGGPQRRGHGQLFQSAPPNRHRRLPGRDRRVAGAFADGPDDDAAGDVGTDADGAVAQHRLGGAAAARGGDYRRLVLGRGADLDRLACPLRDVRAATSARRSGAGVRRRFAVSTRRACGVFVAAAWVGCCGPIRPCVSHCDAALPPLFQPDPAAPPATVRLIPAAAYGLTFSSYGVRPRS